MPAPAEPVRRTHLVPHAQPAEVYAVVVDFDAYPRLFGDIEKARIVEREGQRSRVEFRAKVVMPVRYVLDLVCDPQRCTVDWTFVEGEVVSDSRGGWRFTADGENTRVEYFASMDVKAPLPGFVLRKITDALVGASLPAMFETITREVGHRRKNASNPRV